MTVSSTAPASTGPGTGPLRNGNHRGNPNLAPRCGARARSGCPCRAPAMANGRCRMHGGTSTGPRTKAGMARMIAALTKHGRHGAAGAPQRVEQRHRRTLIVRSRLLAAATRLQAYLPPEMAARLQQGPAELAWPKHPTQVAFEMRQAATPGSSAPPGQVPGGRLSGQASSNMREGAKGKKRSAGTGRAAGDAGVVLRARDTERLAARAVAAAYAPWRAAIAFARAAKRAARGGSPRAGTGTTRPARSNALQPESAVRAGGLHTGGAAAPCPAPTAPPGPVAALRRYAPWGQHAAASALWPAAPGQHAGGKPGAVPGLARLHPDQGRRRAAHDVGAGRGLRGHAGGARCAVRAGGAAGLARAAGTPGGHGFRANRHLAAATPCNVRTGTCPCSDDGQCSTCAATSRWPRHAARARPRRGATPAPGQGPISATPGGSARGKLRSDTGTNPSPRPPPTRGGGESCSACSAHAGQVRDRLAGLRRDHLGDQPAVAGRVVPLEAQQAGPAPPRQPDRLRQLGLRAVALHVRQVDRHHPLGVPGAHRVAPRLRRAQRLAGARSRSPPRPARRRTAAWRTPACATPRPRARPAAASRAPRAARASTASIVVPS